MPKHEVSQRCLALVNHGVHKHEGVWCNMPTHQCKMPAAYGTEYCRVHQAQAQKGFQELYAAN